jgi:hypothetical protein
VACWADIRKGKELQIESLHTHSGTHRDKIWEQMEWIWAGSELKCHTKKLGCDKRKVG